MIACTVYFVSSPSNKIEITFAENKSQYQIQLKKTIMKTIIFGCLALSAITLMSCKKDYTCECKSEGNGVTAEASATSKMKKKDAKEWCDGKAGTSNGVTTKCELK